MDTVLFGNELGTLYLKKEYILMRFHYKLSLIILPLNMAK